MMTAICSGAEDRAADIARTRWKLNLSLRELAFVEA